VKNFLPQLPDLGRVRAFLPGTVGSGTRGGDEPKKMRLAGPGRNDGRGPADRLAMTEVRGHLTFTANTVTAWYTLADQVWPFRADADREDLLSAIATQYAGLGGMSLTVRRTSVPFPIARWVKALEAQATPLPDDPAARYPSAPGGPGSVHVPPTWGRHLASAVDRLAEGNYTQSRTQLGVTLPRASRMLRTVKPRAGDLDEALVARVDEITEDLAVYGMAAHPSTPDELAWLIYRSVGVGLAPPTYYGGDVGPGDIAEFGDNVDWARGPYSQFTELTDRRTGETSFVAVLTVGRMEPQEIPQINQPWAHLSEQVDYPVEWLSRVNILGSGASHGSIAKKLAMILSQQGDYAEHNRREPPELARLAARAAQVGDEITTGLPVDSSRAHGWHRMAVSAPTRKELMVRVRELVRLYDQQAHIALVHPKGQYQLLRSFIPGEDAADTGYLRRMPVMMLAAAMPQATADVGDKRGDLIGETATSGSRPVFLDLHYAMEVREKSGLSVFVAEPGAGKSTLMGALGYLNARRGVQVTLMDPSGPLARLCMMPELRNYSRVVNLVGAERGTLAPYAMIPTPRRADFPTGEAGDHEFEIEVSDAESERSALAEDITQMLLPPQVVDDSAVIVALRDALRMVPPVETSTLDDVIAALDQVAAAGNLPAKTAAGLLHDMSRMPLARTFFGSPPPGTLDTDAALTVITMAGLHMPDPKTDRKYWTNQERLAVPMLHLAHRLAVRRCYGGIMQSRKFVGLDEAHILEGWSSGQAFLTRLARDSRKWNIAALVASQNPKDILRLLVQNLVSTVFVGRIAEDQEVAAEALQLLRVPIGVGYEKTLASLSRYADNASDERLGYREFVMRDVDGRVQKIRVDVSYVAGLLETLDTTPGGTK
jgi:hypothetical protein